MQIKIQKHFCQDFRGAISNIFFLTKRYMKRLSYSSTLFWVYLTDVLVMANNMLITCSCHLVKIASIDENYDN